MTTNQPLRNKDNRKFGLTLGAVLTAVALFQYVKAQAVWPYFACLALGFITLGWIKPSWLLTPRIIWEKLSHYLGFINTIVWLTLIYVLVFVPINIIFKIRGRDLLNRKHQPQLRSYWLTDDQLTASVSLKKQF